MASRISEDRQARLLRASDLAAEQCRQARTLKDDDTEGDFSGIEVETLALMLAVNEARLVAHNE